MLIILLLLNLLGEKAVLRTQIFLVGIALAGIWLISTIGLWSAIFSPEAVKSPSPGSGPAFPGITTALLLFVGFDLADSKPVSAGQDLFAVPLPDGDRPGVIRVVFSALGNSFAASRPGLRPGRNHRGPYRGRQEHPRRTRRPDHGGCRSGRRRSGGKRLVFFYSPTAGRAPG